MKENLIFKAGDINRLEDIFKLYVDARKTKGCTWTEEYPTKEIIKNDILRGDSFVIVNEKNNEIIAAISIAVSYTHLDVYKRQLVYKAAKAKETQKTYSVEAAQAKLYAAEVAMEVTTKAVQLHGGYGYIREYDVERMMRDAKITEIYEGTSEVQRMVRCV